MVNDLHELPKLSDSISYVYIEHAIVEQEDSSVVFVRQDGRVAVPVASTTCLLLGPGTSITHAAVRTICENGCMIVWCGERMGRFYASGLGETRSAKNILCQAARCMNMKAHTEVAKRMYERRFPKLPKQEYTIQQLRGMEGIRVREAYKNASKNSGVPWKARNYKTSDWDESDPINKALSAANSLLYSVCHAAIVSLGYSPALGFVHTGKQLSFVYDIADLYKANSTIPASFEAVKNPGVNLESTVRKNCRRYFESIQLLKKISDDIAWILDVPCEESVNDSGVGELWDELGRLKGGKNYADGELPW